MLRWSASDEEKSFNVWFGTDPSFPGSTFRGNQAATLFCPGTLKPQTLYYWRVDSIDSTNVLTTGTTWRFTTGAVPGAIARVSSGSMPNVPEESELRNWKQVARDFNTLVSNLSPALPGPYLPIPQEMLTPHNVEIPFCWIPSFVGSLRRDGGAFGTMANVVGSSLVGVDKTDVGGRNDVAAMASYYTIDREYFMLSHSTRGGDDETFWYQINANILFWQLTALYPEEAENTPIPGNDGVEYRLNANADDVEKGVLEGILENCADNWHQATIKMADNYAHHGFNFKPGVMAPTDAGTLLPHSAAGIAWLQYLAYAKRKSDKPEYLDDAKRALKYLHDLTYNPAHDFILPYGVYCAARMNAEEGTNYDVAKFMGWHFDLSSDSVSEDVNENTGVEVNAYGAIRVDGLAGKPGLKKVYPANTHVSAGALAPVARYDQRFAKDIGKWLLHVAYNSRYFYPGAFDEDHQTNKEWSEDNDPTSDGLGSIPYEFLSNVAWIVDRPRLYTGSDYTGALGTIEGDDEDSEFTDDDSYLKLKEVVVSGTDRLRRVWKLDLRRGKLTNANGTPAKPHRLKVMGKIIDGGDGDTGFTFYYSTSLDGTWIEIKTVDFLDTQGKTTDEESGNFGDANLYGPIYFKVEDTNQIPGTSPDELWIDCLLVETRDENTTPFLGGGQTSHGRMQTNLCLYQGAYVGFLGAIVDDTDVDKILQIDLLATDFFRDTAYPTYLYYNPFDDPQTVSIIVENPATPEVDVVDVYDTVTHSTLLSSVSGTQSISIPAESARVLVYMPADGTNSYEGRKRKVDGVVVDYYYPVKTRLFFDGFESNSLTLGGWNSYAYYVSVQADAGYSGTRGVRLGRASWIEKAVSTAGYHGIYVKYRRATTGFDTGESLVVEWKKDGLDWQPLETVEQASYDQGLQNKSCGIAASDQPSFRIRFRTTASSSNEFATVDNIEVVGQTD